MPSSRILISSNVLSSTAASVTFSAIPSTYTDLVLRYSARTNEADYYNDTKITFNGSTASNYSVTLLYGSPPNDYSSLRGSNAANLGRSYINANSSTSNTFASGEVYLPSYTTSQNKPIGGFSATENNTANSYQTLIAATAGLFRDTTAISSITMAAQGSTLFVSGSSFYLYGIKNS
jgi:hypothetical protein